MRGMMMTTYHPFIRTYLPTFLAYVYDTCRYIDIFVWDCNIVSLRNSVVVMDPKVHKIRSRQPYHLALKEPPVHPLQLYTWNQHQLLENQSSASKCICICLFPWFGVISTHDWAKYLCVGNFATEPLYPEQADTLQPGWREVVDEILGSDFRNLGIKGQPMQTTRHLMTLAGGVTCQGWMK